MEHWLGVTLRLQGESRPALEELERALALRRRAGDRRGQAVTLNQIGACHWMLGESDQARAAFEEAIALWRGLGEPLRASSTLNHLGVLYQSLGQLRQALDVYRQSLEIFEQAGDQARRATVLDHLGSIYTSLGEPLAAVPLHERALELARSGDHRAEEGEALNHLANLASRFGDGQEALDRFAAALAIFRELGDRNRQAILLNNLSSQYADLGDLDKAQELLGQALPLQRETGDRRGEAATFYNLGRDQSLSGQTDKAPASFQQALAIQREIGDRAGEAATLAALGLHLSGSRPREALEPLARALALYRQLEDATGEARTLHKFGRAQAALGESAAAEAPFEQALRLQSRVRDVPGEVATRQELARLALARSEPEAARTWLEPALELAESLRAQVAGDQLRTIYFASLREIHELYAVALLELHRREPAAGLAARAFEVSEQARARGLLDLLREARVDVRQGVDPQLLEQARRERLALEAKADRQSQILAAPHTAENAAEAEQEVAALLSHLQRTEDLLRTGSPRYAGLTRPEPLRLTDVQRALGPDTLLLEYMPAEPRSFLWAVSPSSLTSFELPGRGEIEKETRRVYELLSRPGTGDPRDRREALARLGQMLLGPVAGQLQEHKLLVVTSGVLQYIPFAALSEPGLAGEAYEPLVLRHEMVSPPSAAVLVELQRSAAHRAKPEGQVAVLADPVFTADDPRVARPAGAVPARGGNAALPASDAERSASDLGESGFPRLAWTRREAQAIASQAGGKGLLLALDFEASRETVTGPRLGQYRIVHFATHGLLNSHHPELSGLVLSLVDPQGRPQDGFLRLGDIYNLNLNTELVVLSGCRTALGQEIRGEGLLGLTRGFLYAGSSQVMASLWAVRDRATAELMERFYRSLLRDGLAPAAALRSAQASMWREPRWRDPYFWAAFVLQGDGSPSP
jgi:CHAT domain-containing protein/Tfp pilus assembly protein PilF